MINRITPNSFTSSMSTGAKEKLDGTDKHASQKTSTRDSSSSSIDTFGFKNFTSEDLTPEGKIPIIITNKDKKSIDRLKGDIAKNFSSSQASVKDELPLVNGIKVEVDPYNFRKLMKSLPKKSKVVLDSKIKFPTPKEIKEKMKQPDANERPALDISNSTLGLNRLWEKGYTGKGVGICIIDSGIYPHEDFEGRIKGFKDIKSNKKKPYDPYGHGTHIAGVAAGSGIASAGKYRGVAPDADIIGVRITSVNDAIKGIQWAIENKDKYNIRVINMSLGDYPIRSYKDDPWAQAAKKAWDEGIVVVVAAGNEGPGEGTISTPGIHPDLITVGAIDDENTPEREDDHMARFSSRGPTTPDKITKPDLVAPGVDIYGPLAPGSTLDTPDLPHDEGKYIALSGSSMSTPLVSGLAALLIQANPDLKPADIKKILVSTADKYLPNADENDQGAGLVDPMESLEVALGKKKPRVIASNETSSNLPMLIADNLPGKTKKSKKAGYTDRA